MRRPRREHSRKPEEIYSRIEALVAGPYLELFARETRPGWDQWGDQTGLFDHAEVDTRRIPYSSSSSGYRSETGLQPWRHRRAAIRAECRGDLSW
jgi:hypothetical protein